MSVHRVSPDAVPTWSRAAVFINPMAGARKAYKILAEVQRVLATSGIPSESYVPASAQEFESQAKAAVEQGVPVLFGVGGDGTVQILANAAYGTRATIGIVPAGGGNDFAASLGIRRGPLKALRSLLSGEVRSVDALRVRVAGGCERIYCGGGGVGLDAQAARYACGVFRRFPGRLRYVFSALAALRACTPIRVCVEFPDAQTDLIEKRVMLAAALNTPTYGAGLKIAEGARIDDGNVEVVVVEPLSGIEVLRVLTNWICFDTLRTRRAFRWSAKRVRIHADPPSAFHADGEILGNTPVEIEVMPKAIRVLAPARNERFKSS